MPTYDYKCKECGAIQEEFHKMNDSPQVICRACGCKMVKLISYGGGVIFKGSGFYETDYKRPDNVNKEILKQMKEHTPDDQLKAGGVDRKDL